LSGLWDGRRRRAMTRNGALQLDLLRGFSLRSGGEVLELPLMSQRLVAFLALQERPVQRVFVAGTLWIGADDDRAGASLRTALWRLTRAVPGLVHGDGATLSLSLGVAVDLWDASERARLLIEHPDEHCQEDLELLGRTGDLLPDWYDDWLLIERERFRQLRLHALESLSRALAAGGRYAHAADAGLAAVACEPLRETAHRAVINAYLAEGNAVEALRHYEIFRTLLADSVGLEPSGRMEILMSSVRAR
jgi:DNA-binding SARP family transcriptional activator